MTIALEDLPEEMQQMIESHKQTLEPLAPEDGVKQYLESKTGEIRSQTVEEYSRKLDHFLDYCEQNDIENLNSLSGRDLKDYAKYRRENTAPTGDQLTNNTLRDDMYLMRDMCRFLAEMEAVDRNLSKKVDIPSLNAGDGVRDLQMDPDRINQILQHLETYEYASRDHVIWCLKTETGRRPSDIHALDVEDAYVDNDASYIEVVHRENTQLKNGENGETTIAISDRVARTIKDYISDKRIDVKTETGRKPLLTSQHGRLSKISIRKAVYQYSCPCVVTNECPHGRDIRDCDAAQKVNHAYECPSSEPPYALRHSYITEKRNQGVPIDVLTERCDASEPVIDKHYDERDDDEKRELRRQILEQARDERDNGGRYL